MNIFMANISIQKKHSTYFTSQEVSSLHEFNNQLTQ